jgi:hypothetical protein
VASGSLASADAGGGEEWVTVEEAARRLDRSPSWFRALAKQEGIEVRRGGRRPGVSWADVEQFIARSRITRVNETLLRQVAAETPGARRRAD